MEEFSVESLGLMFANMVAWFAVMLLFSIREKDNNRVIVVYLLVLFLLSGLAPERTEANLYLLSFDYCIISAIGISLLAGKQIVLRRGKKVWHYEYALSTFGVYIFWMLPYWAFDFYNAWLNVLLFLVPMALSAGLAEVLRRALDGRCKLSVLWASGISLLLLEAAAAVWFLAQPYYLLVMFALFQGTLLELSYGGYLAAKKMAGVAK